MHGNCGGQPSLRLQVKPFLMLKQRGVTWKIWLCVGKWEPSFLITVSIPRNPYRIHNFQAAKCPKTYLGQQTDHPYTSCIQKTAKIFRNWPITPSLTIHLNSWPKSWMQEVACKREKKGLPPIRRQKASTHRHTTSRGSANGPQFTPFQKEN